MSSNETKKIILPEGVSIPEVKEAEDHHGIQGPVTDTGDFPFKVKFIAPIEFKLVEFITKEGNLQGPRKLVAILPTGEAVVVVPDIRALPMLSEEEIQAMNDWEIMLREKAKLLGGNIVIDPATGDIKAAPMPPGMSAMLGNMARGSNRNG